MAPITTSAPAKAILFGEHAVNRGQSAIAVSIGLRLRCTARPGGGVFHLRSAGHARTYTRDDITALGAEVDAWREAQDYGAIRALAGRDYYAPAQYILAHALRAHPELGEGLDIAYASDIPPSGGLGSGGAANVALAAALVRLADGDPSTTGALAYLGDVIAHGGVASALDTQTSLRGGAIRYTAERWGERIPVAQGLTLVIGDTGVRAQTSEVNTRVREWLAADAARMRSFEMIGALSRAAEPMLETGDWAELGKLMNLNQLVLEKIGVSCPELDGLIGAALRAGALGAKLSGSGGGGIMIALTTDERRTMIADALLEAGARAVFAPAVAVDGVWLA